MPNSRRHKKSKSRSKIISVDSKVGSLTIQDDFSQNEEQVYQINYNEQLGRYLLAKRSIQAGEMIIENDYPLIIGPVQQSDILCLGCYQRIEDIQNKRCMKCNWPICGSSCCGVNHKLGHTTEECDLLLQFPFDQHLQLYKQNIYNFIVPMRCLLQKKSSPSTYKIISSMESHNEVRYRIQSIWEFNQTTVVEKLRNYFDENEIHTVCGILEVNSFEVNVDNVSLRALFPTACLMSHDCVPNTMHTNDGNFTLKVRASLPIAEGYPITVSYAYTLLGTAKRRAHVKETKFFECTCRRCADPSELGSNMSTLVCSNCLKPNLIRDSPLKHDNLLWICKSKKCARVSLTQSYVDGLIERFENDLKSISESDIEGYENWLKKAISHLHTNHYLIVGVKYTLSLLYGKIEGYMMHEMSEDLLKRKINICEELLEVADIIEPGLSRFRGVILYELQASMMMLLQKTKAKCNSKKLMKHTMRRIFSCLQQASNILRFDSVHTMEGKIGLDAYKTLLANQQWEQALGKL